MNPLHKEQQARARAAKAKTKAARLEAERMAKRRMEDFYVTKEDLLKMLIAEGHAPEGAMRIIQTGHDQEKLHFTVIFE